jgi:WD40 repeat protein
VEAQAFGPFESTDLTARADRVIATGDSTATLVSFPLDPELPAASVTRIAADSARVLAPVPLKVVLPEGTAFERTSVTLVRGAVEQEIEVDGPVLAAAASPDGARVAIVSGNSTRGGWERRLRVLDAGSRQVLADTLLPGFASDAVAAGIAYSGDGRHLIVTTPDGFQGWDAGTFAPAFEIFPGNAAGLETQPGGTLAVTFGRGDTRIWDATTGTEVGRIEHDGWPAARAAISADGDWLVTTHDDGALRVWALSPAALLAQACATRPGPAGSARDACGVDL